jgi:hypothetical protein
VNAIPPQLRRPLAAFVTVKALAVAALLAGRHYYFTSPGPWWNYHVYTGEQAGAWLAFINWDGQHYLKLALGGYPLPADPSTAFYPLFPALIALGIRIGLDPIAAGLTVVTVCSLAVFVLLPRLLPEEDKGSLWLFACFPTAFYLSVVYSEALFLAALLGLFWALRDPRRAGLAISCAALLPLVHGQGMWLALPLAAAWIFPGPLARRSLAGASIGYALGVVAYFGFFAWRYGDPFAGFAAQKFFFFHNSVANIFDVQRFFDSLFKPPARFLDINNSGLDKLAIVASFAALAYGIRRSPDAFFGTAWACFAVLPAMMGEGASYARHALVAWACFALAAGPGLRPPARTLVVATGFALQVYLAFVFGANHWVG